MCQRCTTLNHVYNVEPGCFHFMLAHFVSSVWWWTGISLGSTLKFLTSDRIVLLQSHVLFFMVIHYCWGHPTCAHLLNPKSWILLMSLPCSSHIAGHSLWSFCCFRLNFPQVHRCQQFCLMWVCDSFCSPLYWLFYLRIPHTISVLAHNIFPLILHKLMTNFCHQCVSCFQKPNYSMNFVLDHWFSWVPMFSKWCVAKN